MPSAVNGARSSRAFSRKAREVMTCFSPARRAQARIVGTPEEKFSSAGTRPVAQSERIATGVPLTLGRSRPTRFAPGASRSAVHLTRRASVL